MAKPAPAQILSKTVLVFGCLLLILLSALPRASTLFFTWPWVFYGQLLLLAPIFLFGWQLLITPTHWRREWTALGAMALAIGISVIFCRRPAFSLEVALFLFSGLAWTALVSLKASSSNEPKIVAVRFIALLFLLPLLAGLIYWLNDWSKNVESSDGVLASLRSLFAYRNLFPFGHWNYTGGFALLALPWFLTLTFVERSRWRVVWVVSTLVTTIMFFSASSRGAVLGALAAMAAVFVGAIYTRKLSRKQSVVFTLLACALATGVWYANPRLRAIITDPSAVLQPNEGDVQRIAMLQGGWLLAQQRPWLGHGPGMTPFVYPTVRAQLVGGVETSFQLHNGPLQLLVDHGLIGILCALGMIALFLQRTWRWLKAPPSLPRSLALTSATALLGYFVMFVTDYQLNVLAFVAAIGLQAGLVLAEPNAAAVSTSRNSRWVGAGFFAAGIGILLILFPSWRARNAFWKAWETDSPTETIALLEEASKIAPDNPYYLNQLALRRARNAETATDVSTPTALRAQARTELARSLKIDPAQEPVHAALGWLWLNENPKQAETHFRAAIALLPDRDTLHFGLALSLLAQNDQAGALHELALECLSNPLFIASPLWAQEPLLPLHDHVMEQLFEDYTYVLQLPATPQWRKPHLLYAAAFVRWWLGGQPPTAAELKGALPHQQHFFAQLATPNPLPTTNQTYPWDLLAQARLAPSKAEAILNSPDRPPTKQAIAGALARLSRPMPDLATLLRSQEPTNIGIVSNQITRTHYSIMNNVLDGPGYEDLAPRISDAFTAEYAGALFSLRSAIPGPVMRKLMSNPQ